MIDATYSEGLKSLIRQIDDHDNWNTLTKIFNSVLVVGALVQYLQKAATNMPQETFIESTAQALDDLLEFDSVTLEAIDKPAFKVVIKVIYMYIMKKYSTIQPPSLH